MSGRSPGVGNGNPPVFLLRKFHGQRSLADDGVSESDTTECAHTHDIS